MPASSTASDSKVGPRLLMLALPLLGWAVYINSLTNPFVYDDFRLIVENDALKTGDLWAVVWRDITRPVVNLSYAADAAIWGVRPLGFHVTNVLLHAVNILLVFAAAMAAATDASARRRAGAVPPAAGEGTTGSARTVATVTALLFAVHPMLSQSVGYVSARSELLCAAFVLLATLAARRFLLGGRAWWAAAAFLAWLLALGSKEVAAMLPVALVAYDLLVLPRPASRRRLALHVPMWLLLLGAVSVRVWVLQTVEYGNTGVDGGLAFVALDAFRRYLLLLLVPAGQTIFHALVAIDSPFDRRVLATVALFGGLAALGWRGRRAIPLLLFGLLWFVIFLVPSAALFVLGRGEALAEHRVYLSSAGVFLAAAAVLDAAVSRLGQHQAVLRWTVFAAVAVVALQLGARTLLRNAVWSDPVALWRESVNKAPQHWLPHLMLGEVLRPRAGCAAAEPEYRLAIRFAPEESFAYTKLGGCLIERRQLDEAERVYIALRESAPTSADGPTGLAIVAMLKGAPNYSRAYLQEALVRDSSAIVPRQLLATLEEPRDPATALRLCREIRELAPSTPGNDECIRRNAQRVAQPPSSP